MVEHFATVAWTRDGARFTDARYSRAHAWHFDGGSVVRAAASPHVVPPALTDVAAVDPEEAFVAALSSCHMLWFLSLAARAGLVVDDYRDDAVGVMGRDEAGRQAMLEVVLRPAVTLSGSPLPDDATLLRLHEEAHAACFIANSVRTRVRCEPVPRRA